MITTGIALGFILRGKVLQHRQWMTRSFAVAIVFLEVRVVLGVTGLEKLGGAFDERNAGAGSPIFKPSSVIRSLSAVCVV